MKKGVLRTPGVALLMVVLLFSLIGCSGSTSTSGDSSVSTSGNNSTSTSGDNSVSTSENTNPLAGAQVGDVVHFGEVSFTDSRGGTFKGDIGWRVLAVEDGRALVISEDIIDLRLYNENDTDTTWEQCDLRAWLNGAFFDGLPHNMQSAAQVTKVVNSDNSEYGTPGGNNTDDKVFLLSIDEAAQYFKDDNDRMASYYGSSDWWWLRSPGNGAGGAAIVDYDDGHVSPQGSRVTYAAGVRPALWLNL